MNTFLEYIVPALLIVGFLFGIRLMQSPRTARMGNGIGALCMSAAVLLTLWTHALVGEPLVWTALAVGGGAGLGLAWRARTIRMPQLVALLNGSGGAASALVIAASIGTLTGGAGGFTWFVSALALGVGSLTFGGSIVAALKLQGWLTPRPLLFKGQAALMRVLVGVAVILVAVVTVSQQPVLLYVVTILFLMHGFMLALRVGGADMPVIISFLNSLSGVAAAVSGLALGNLLAAGVGAVVGVAGMILTRLMCVAMNRNLAAVLSGFKQYVQAEAAPEASGAAHRDRLDPSRVPALLREARTVLIVPGYGMALAQAQQAVKELIDALGQAGKQVKVAVHPVAGRMPGHMHVLLAEAGVDYEQLYDMAKINHEFAETDVVVAVGACDVMNPAATTAEGTPLFGMPILKVHEAKAVVVCNLDDKPGYSGVPNTLYGQPHVITLWGDAAETVPGLARALAEKPGSTVGR